MAIYLGHTTAQRILESRLAKDIDSMASASLVEPTSARGEVRKYVTQAFGDEYKKQLSTAFYQEAKEPLDLIVADTLQRRVWRGVRCHILPEGVPKESFFMLREGIMVACPELCLVQQCERLTLIEAIKLAMKLCGVYKLVGDEEDKNILSRKPVMTIDNAFAYLDQLREVPGMDMARRALHYALPMSGSPMETVMALLLCLPVRMGGFGLPRPTMNFQVGLDDRALAIANKVFPRGIDPVLAVDAKWNDLIFEFQSWEYHDSARAYGEDYARQLALQSMGYTVQFVTIEQLRNADQLTELARMVAHEMGSRLSAAALRCVDRRAQLFADLVK